MLFLPSVFNRIASLFFLIVFTPRYCVGYCFSSVPLSQKVLLFFSLTYIISDRALKLKDARDIYYGFNYSDKGTTASYCCTEDNNYCNKCFSCNTHTLLCSLYITITDVNNVIYVIIVGGKYASFNVIYFLTSFITIHNVTKKYHIYILYRT